MSTTNSQRCTNHLFWFVLCQIYKKPPKSQSSLLINDFNILLLGLSLYHMKIPKAFGTRPSRWSRKYIVYVYVYRVMIPIWFTHRVRKEKKKQYSDTIYDEQMWHIRLYVAPMSAYSLYTMEQFSGKIRAFCS